MNTFTMSGADQSVALHHLAFYGLADILDDAGVPDVRLSWHGPLPVITGEGLTPQTVDDAVRAHITGRRSWSGQVIGPERRGLMSPRLSVLKTREGWAALQLARHRCLDALTDDHAWSDLRYLAALGEPCYWRFTPKDEPLQDDGASRWEMQPRNRGSEFIGNRIRPLSDKLLGRAAGQLAAGLEGTTILDELGGRPDSVSATGMTTPGPVDNALVWCALWGIGNFPIAAGTTGTAVTSGHIGRTRHEWFHVPVWEGHWRPARLRSILAGDQLRCVAAGGLPRLEDHDVATRSAATWLKARGVLGVLRFPIGRFGSDNAPERRALRAEPVRLGRPS